MSCARWEMNKALAIQLCEMRQRARLSLGGKSGARKMSDPVTNSEIEDVLSSIRRLVSNEVRDDKGERSPKQEDEPGDKLVLTPALRVDGQPGNARSDEPDADADVEELISSLGDLAEDGQTPGAEEDSGGSADVAAPDGLRGDDPEAAVDGDDARATADTSEVPGSGEPVARRETRGAGVLEARVAEFEAAVAAREDQWEPDGESDDDYAGGRMTSLPWKEGFSDPADDVSADPADDVSAEPVPDISADPAPDDDEQAANGDEVDGHEEPDPFGFGTRPDSDDAEDGAAEELSELSDAVLDEDALRDLISEIVRQELQGALGERITRNVRKLVRREIHRALASQKME